MLLEEEELLGQEALLEQLVVLVHLEPLEQEVHLEPLEPLVQEAERAHLAHPEHLVQQALLEQVVLEERVEWVDP